MGRQPASHRPPAVHLAAALAVLAWLVVAPARAQPLGAGDPAARDQARVDDPTFGPLLTIEDIELQGNESTAARVILRALPIGRGDVLRAGDPRFQKARFKLLATGYFRAVDLDLRKGSRRGHVVLAVRVKERGTVVLNGLYFGTSLATPWWLGLDATERNFLGTGLGVGAGAVFADRGDIDGATAQAALRLRLAASSIAGSRLGVHGALLYNRASEPYRVQGPSDDAAPRHFRAFPYTRAGLVGGVDFDLTPLSRVSVNARAELVDATPPAAPTRTLPDGTTVPVDIAIEPGRSRVVTLSVGFDRDTRADPVLPFNGHRWVVLAEAGGPWLGSSYQHGLALTRYQRWWQIGPTRHVVSVHFTAGLVLGQAPRFDRLHVSDFNRLQPPRALDLVVSTTSAPDFLGAGADELTYGELGGSAIVEYSYQLFRSRFHVYGGDVFVGAGLWTLVDGDAPPALEVGVPVDLVVDAGLRIDTEIGIFELTFANALGRLPI